jgi:hypothetical protein
VNILSIAASTPTPMVWLATLWQRASVHLRMNTPARRSRKAHDDQRHQIAAVRELAYQHLRTDPRFAADLFAAADRHELLAGGDSNAQPNTQR